MNDGRITEIRARADAATAGPWTTDSDFRYGRRVLADLEPEGEYLEVAECSGYVMPSPATVVNAEFIAHARQDVPWLLDALAAARAENARLVETLEASRIPHHDIGDDPWHDMDGRCPCGCTCGADAHNARIDAALAPAPAGADEVDEYRRACPNGCLGEWGEGTNGQPVPKYCGVSGCDVESPGMAYWPD